MGKQKLRLKRKRQKLYDADPNCPFCGVEMIMPHLCHRKDPRMVTFEHLVTRLDPMRQHPTPNETRVIICCQKCNHERGILDQIKFGVYKTGVSKYKQILQLADG